MLKLLSLLVLPTALVAGPPCRVAVIGLVHGHAWGHLTEIMQSSGAELVGLSEPNAALRAQARRAGVPDRLFFADYRKMLDSAKPDIVWAFVENNRHLEIVRACASRKINVILEKPLASTYADALAIRDLAHQSGIMVMTNYQMAWWPASAAAQRVVESGQLGRIFSLRARVGHGGPSSKGPANQAFFDWLTDPVTNGGGALVDFGCYSAVWSLTYLGRPETVYARADRLQPARFPKVEDHAIIVLGYPEANALIEASWDLPRSYQDLELVGRTGSLDLTATATEVRRGAAPGKLIALDALPVAQGSPLAYMINAIRTNGPPGGIVGLDINVEVMEIIDAAERSIQSGQVVQMAPSPSAAARSRLVTQLAAGRPQRLVIYGTSLSRGGAWVDQLKAALDRRYPGLTTLINGAKNGQNSRWGLANVEKNVIAHNPDTVFVEFSINDSVARFNLSLAESRRNLEGMIDRIAAALPRCEIILQIMNPVVGKPVGDPSYRRDQEKYQQIYRDVAAARGLLVIDHSPAWRAVIAHGGEAEFLHYVRDGVHPSAEGCAKFVTPAILASIGLGGPGIVDPGAP